MRSLLGLMVILLALPKNVNAESLTGVWLGTWQSNSTGHQGPLRARFQPINEMTYRVIYSGRFAKVIPFIYVVRMSSKNAHEMPLHLYGETKLGPILGTYHYQATVNGNQFQSLYHAKKDHGIFNLTKIR